MVSKVGIKSIFSFDLWTKTGDKLSLKSIKNSRLGIARLNQEPFAFKGRQDANPLVLDRVNLERGCHVTGPLAIKQ